MYFKKFWLILTMMLLLMAVVSPVAAQDDDTETDMEESDMMADTEAVEIRQWASSAVASSEFTDTDWSAMQATGAPDVTECGDYAEAWASETPGEIATLEVYYETPVLATEINIVQTYNPNFVSEVELISIDSLYESIYEGEVGLLDESEPCPYTLTIPVEQPDYLVMGVRITVDPTEIGDWNEIDAVELVGIPGTVDMEVAQWATLAAASSEFSADEWSAMQATGEPDAEECASLAQAWASESTGELATLEVYYNLPVYATEVNIIQSHNPNFVANVDLITPDADYITVYEGEVGLLDESEPCPYTLSIPLEQTEFPVQGVSITVDQTMLEDWNEIDAVQLVGFPEIDVETPNLRQWAVDAVASSEYGYDNAEWTAMQATGEPNVLECGDSFNAWASETQDEVATLEVYYETPVFANEVNIVQNYNPNFVSEVEFIDLDGNYISFYEGEIGLLAESEPCPFTLELSGPQTEFLVQGVRLTVDQSDLGDWNEIDAVELVGMTEAMMMDGNAEAEEETEMEAGDDVDTQEETESELDTEIEGE